MKMPRPLLTAAVAQLPDSLRTVVEEVTARTGVLIPLAASCSASLRKMKSGTDRGSDVRYRS
jgi:hypothetical protein